VDSEKYLFRIIAEIEKRNLETFEEADAFIKEFNRKLATEGYPDTDDNKIRSQELVLDAFDLPDSEGMKLVKKAYKLDPENPDIYNYFGLKEKKASKAIKYFQKALKLAEKRLGKEYLEENKGAYGKMVQSRPYLRAKDGIASSLMFMNKKDLAIEKYEELWELDKTDRMNVVEILSKLYVEMKYFDKFEKMLEKINPEDNTVVCYNNFLYHYLKYGDSKKTREALKLAISVNKHVVDFLLGEKELTDESFPYTIVGSEEEAQYYLTTYIDLWVQLPGAYQLLIDFIQDEL